VTVLLAAFTVAMGKGFGPFASMYDILFLVNNGTRTESWIVLVEKCLAAILQ
jgi:hypothetical protein